MDSMGGEPGSEDIIPLPPDHPNWPVVKSLLQDVQRRLRARELDGQETGWYMQYVYDTIQSDRVLTGSVDTQLESLKEQIQGQVKRKLSVTSVWFGVIKFLKKVPSDEGEKFLYSVLPRIIEMALRIEELRPGDPLRYSRRQKENETSLSRMFVCSVVACFFLCLFKDRKRDRSSALNIVNFTNFFKHLPMSHQIAKLRCILHYFECVIERQMEIPGSIVFCRRVASMSQLVNFEDLLQCNLHLCSLNVMTEGAIEDSGGSAIHVDFANRSIGGGALGRGRVQEEIKFCMCPELLVSMLFMENMEDNESIMISGFEQFSVCTGYAATLEFAGHFDGQAEGEVSDNCIVAMDAVSYKSGSPSRQYEVSWVMRDLNKALVAFTGSSTLHRLKTTGAKECTAEKSPEADSSAMSFALGQAKEPSPSSVPLASPTQLSQLSGLNASTVPRDRQSPSLSHFDRERRGHSEETVSIRDRISKPYSLAEEPQTKLNVTTTDSSAQVSQVIHPSAQPITSFPHHQSAADNHLMSVVGPSVDFSHPTVLDHHQPASEPTLPPTLPHTAELVPELTMAAQPLHSSEQPSALTQCVPSLTAAASQRANTPAASNVIVKDSTPLSVRVNTDIDEAVLSTLHSPPVILGGELVSDILGNLGHSQDMLDIPIQTLREQSEHHGFRDSPHSHFSIDVCATHSSEDRASVGAGVSDTDIDDMRLLSVSCESLPAHHVQEARSPGVSSTCRHRDLTRESSDVSNVSNFSMTVNVDSQSISAYSTEDDSSRRQVLQPSPINMEGDVGTASSQRFPDISLDMSHLDPALRSSPHSSFSSLNVSPNSSFVLPEHFHPEPLNGSSDVHVTADFFIPVDGEHHNSEEHGAAEADILHGGPQNGTRDIYSELREFLSSSSSGSRSSGSGMAGFSSGALGSRSGSISSHGTNGSSNDFLDFWNHFRRRSSQLSDPTSRRSSSSKHSTDFSTDLEVREIAEALPAHSHGVIEEEGSLVTLISDFASQFVSTAMVKAVVSGAQDVAGVEVAITEQGEAAPAEIKPSLSDTVQSAKTTSSVITKPPGDDAFSNSKGAAEKTPAVTEERLKQSESKDEKQAVSKGKERILRLGGRTSTLVRQEEVEEPIDQTEPQPTADVEQSTSVSSLQTVEQAPSLGSAQAVDHSETKPSGTDSAPAPKLSTCIIPVLHPPKLSSSDKPLQSPRIKALRASQSTPYQSPSHSLDSGFISGKSSVSSMGVFDVDSSVLDSSDHGHDPFLQSSTPKPESAMTMTTISSFPIPAPVKAHIPVSKSEERKTMFATLETKNIYLTDENIPQSRKPQSNDKPPSKSDALSSSHSSKPEHTSSQATSASDTQAVPLVSVTSHAGTKQTQAKSEKKRDSGSVKKAVYTKTDSAHRRSSLSTKRSLAEAKAHSKHSSGTKDSSVSSAHLVKEHKRLFKAHKSRYIFSDVAPPLVDKRGKSKNHISKSAQTRDRGRKEAKRKRKEEAKKKASKDFTQSPQLYRFVSSLAERTLSQAVLEAAERLSGQSSGTPDQVVTEEVVNWFATKIINEVFFHVVSELEVREYHGQNAREVVKNEEANGASSGPGESAGAASGIDLSSTLSTQLSETKLKSSASSNIPPARKKKSDQPLSRSGSTKTVSFEDVKKGSATSKHYDTPLSVNVSSVEQGRGRRGRTSPGSTGLASQSPPHRGHEVSPASSRLSGTSQSELPAPLRHSRSFSEFQSPSLTPTDLSVDVYQAAASIVNTVFQSISDSMDTQLMLSPSSASTRHGSSLDNHSTGSGFHYDSFTSNIFSSSSTKASGGSPKRARRSLSPSIGIFSRKPMSRQTLTSAYLKVDSGAPYFKTYERRSSEPCSTSVQLSLQAFNNNKFNTRTAADDRHRKISRTDDDIGYGRGWRRGSLDGFSFERRNSCGFKDPILSQFAEELMKADTSVPELVIVGSRPSSSTSGSRRSSISGFRDTTLANLESELLNTSFTSVGSLPLSQSPRSGYRQPHMDRSRSRESRHGKSDSSETEYWFPPPRCVGEEFQLEFDRQHSQDELQDYASLFAGQVVQEAVCVLKNDPDYMSQDEANVDIYAENLSDQIIREALITTTRGSSDHQRQQQEQSSSSQTGAADGFRYVLSQAGDSVGIWVTTTADGMKIKSSRRSSQKSESDGSSRSPRKSSDGRTSGSKQHRKSETDLVRADISHSYGRSRPRPIPARKSSRDERGRLNETGVCESCEASEARGLDYTLQDVPSAVLSPSIQPHFSQTASRDNLSARQIPLGSYHPHSPSKSRSTDWGGARPKKRASQTPQSMTLLPSGVSKSSKTTHRHSSSSSASSSFRSPQQRYSYWSQSAPVGSSTAVKDGKRSGDIPQSGSMSRDGSSQSAKDEVSKAYLAQLSMEVSHRSRSSSCSTDQSDETSSLMSTSPSTDSEGSIGPTGSSSPDMRDILCPANQSFQQEAPLSPTLAPSISTTTQGRSTYKLTSSQREGRSRRSRQTVSSTGSSSWLERRELRRRSGTLREGKELDQRGETEELVCSAETEGYADDLGLSILASAMEECQKSKWIQYRSYQRTIATGNWGCGAFRGDAQLKFVIQWMAASIARAPLLSYYTFGDRRLTQAEEIVPLLHHLTVGQLASLVLEYCHMVCQHVQSSTTVDTNFITTFKTSCLSHATSSPAPRRAASTQVALSQGASEDAAEDIPEYSLWQLEHEAMLPETLFKFIQRKFRVWSKNESDQ